MLSVLNICVADVAFFGFDGVVCAYLSSDAANVTTTAFISDFHFRYELLLAAKLAIATGSGKLNLTTIILR